MTSEITKGTYQVRIQERKDGGFMAMFLYNVGTELHQSATGDVWEIKTFKTMKTCERKAEAYFAMQGA